MNTRTFALLEKTFAQRVLHRNCGSKIGSLRQNQKNDFEALLKRILKKENHQRQN